MWHETDSYSEEKQYGYQRKNSDYDGDSEYSQKGSYIIPEVIKNFLNFFQLHIQEKNVYEIQNAYEEGFNKLTDRFFENGKWPSADIVATYMQTDEIFLILYKELYYRHIYAKFGPTFNERVESFQNYCQLFNYIIDAKHPVSLVLPNQWLWDIIDEFIYQYQSFSQYCSKVSEKSEEEIESLSSNTSLWSVHHVINVLHTLVDKSDINLQLEAYISGEDPEMVAGEFGCHELYKMLGYFSLVGLLRLHSMLGDYHLALKAVDKINFIKKQSQPSHFRVSTCHITTCYYVGFAYMMMRRYQDAITTFTDVLLFIHKTKQHFQNKTYLYNQLNKQNEQMLSLLVVCLALHPMSIDETISSYLRENFSDQLANLQKGDLKEYEHFFQFACPKFLFAHSPNLSAIQSTNYHREPYLQQLNVFLAEVQSQLNINTIRSYLRLYTTMPISKLAYFMNMTEQELIGQLMCFKHKMHNMVWSKGSSYLEGEFQSNSELDFYIDKDMIHIADTKVERKYGSFFIMNILKFNELNQQLRSERRYK